MLGTTWPLRILGRYESTKKRHISNHGDKRFGGLRKPEPQKAMNTEGYPHLRSPTTLHVFYESILT